MTFMDVSKRKMRTVVAAASDSAQLCSAAGRAGRGVVADIERGVSIPKQENRAVFT